MFRATIVLLKNCDKNYISRTHDVRQKKMFVCGVQFSSNLSVVGWLVSAEKSLHKLYCDDADSRQESLALYISK